MEEVLSRLVSLYLLTVLIKVNLAMTCGTWISQYLPKYWSYRLLAADFNIFIHGYDFFFQNSMEYVEAFWNTGYNCCSSWDDLGAWGIRVPHSCTFVTWCKSFLLFDGEFSFLANISRDWVVRFKVRTEFMVLSQNFSTSQPCEQHWACITPLQALITYP